MAAYSPGEILKLHYVPEVTYGTTPTSALTWGCEYSELTVKGDMGREFHVLSDGGVDGTYTTTTSGPYSFDFNVKGYSRADSGTYEWYDFWGVYSLGGTTIARHPGSFSCQTGKTVGATTNYWVFNGCKMDKLRITAESPGKPIVFDADVMAQFMTKSTSKTIAGLQALTVGADPAEITTGILTWNGVSQININGGGLANWYPKSWKLTIDNHMEKAPGNKVGADGLRYPLAAYAINEGQRDIILEVTLPYGDETYTDIRLANTLITAVTLPVDTFNITLTTGYTEANDFPTLKHAVNEEVLKIRFQTAGIA